jgi:hypothetical protein
MGWTTVYLPSAAIEYVAGVFDSEAAGGVLHDITAGDTSKWKDNSVSQFTTIIGYAHQGRTGLTQNQANANVTKIQIWGWLDSNGDGEATYADAYVIGNRTTRWTKLSELTPSTGSGDVVGWEVGTSDTTSEWADILQTASGGTAIDLGEGESWLLMVRVVDTAGNTNLMNMVGGSEQWEDGTLGNGVGSEGMPDVYVDADGNTPGTADGRIEDDDVVWVYRPKS